MHRLVGFTMVHDFVCLAVFEVIHGFDDKSCAVFDGGDDSQEGEADDDGFPEMGPLLPGVEQ